MKNMEIPHVVVGLIPRKSLDNKIEYLMISSRKDFGIFTGLLYPPGGHVEQGETNEKALKREIFEELNIDIEIIGKVDETAGDVKNQVTHWYICKEVPTNIQIKTDEIEIDKVIWVKEDEILDNKDKFWPATFNFLEKYLTSKSSQ